MHAWDYRPLDSPVPRAQGREATLEEALRACRLHARCPLVWREEPWGVWTAPSPDGRGRYAVYPSPCPRRRRPGAVMRRSPRAGHAGDAPGRGPDAESARCVMLYVWVGVGTVVFILLVSWAIFAFADPKAKPKGRAGGVDLGDSGDSWSDDADSGGDSGDAAFSD